MIVIKHTIISGEGMHARPASDFCQLAMELDSKIQIKKDGEIYEGKSILSVLSMGAMQGDIIEIIIDGSDEIKAHEAMSKLLLTI